MNDSPSFQPVYHLIRAFEPWVHHSIGPVLPVQAMLDARYLLPEPQECRLKDGRSILIRPVLAGDAKEVLDLEYAVVAQGAGVVKVLADLPSDEEEMLPYVDEWAKMSPVEGVRLVAVLDGRLVADATAERLSPTLVNHVAILTLQVHPEVQGQGIGRMMLLGLLEWAHQLLRESNRPLKRLEMYVLSENIRAQSLYRSVGFQLEGVRRCFHRAIDGSFHDDYVMGLLLDLES
ncbi:GNAT family N-acetyltransferase [Cyanobium sp. FGCU-52]|nr:GNAT family N-acetyltransferase [Cyanobium sp. FGCU52]